MLKISLFFLVVTCSIIFTVFYTIFQIFRPFDNQRLTSEGAVVFLGDSLTKATISGSFISPLKKNGEYSNKDILNFGVNGLTTAGLLKKIETIELKKDDQIFILIGTNDIDQNMDIDLAVLNVEKVIQNLRQLTSNITLITIPPLREEKTSIRNTQISKYNQLLKDISKKDQISLIDFHSEFSKLMDQSPLEFSFPFPLNYLEPGFINGYAHFILGKSFDQMAKERGFDYFIDTIHLSQQGADILSSILIRPLASISK
ncbi:MAG: hypothetical protein HOE90_01640 [Bacteriovoracaceae bacterium]|jgi:acyl-CoA thioesterase I|nr:hypothetical protein [Bacteriovoracaceae bacterium]